MVPTIYKRLIQIGKISGAISFLFAAPYALIQYWQAQKSARIEQTLNMYKLYNAGPFTGYRGKITKALIKNRDKLNQAAVNEISLTAAQTGVVRKENIEMELLLVMDFFDGLAVCVKGQVCDDETAIKLFKPRAYDVYLNFFQYIKLQRDTSATYDFGGGLEAVAKSGKPPPRPPLVSKKP
jgi:hypothetical protein